MNKVKEQALLHIVSSVPLIASNECVEPLMGLLNHCHNPSSVKDKSADDPAEVVLGSDVE